jgi:hypothetical protein
MLLIMADGVAVPVVITSWEGRDNSVDWIPFTRFDVQHSTRMTMRGIYSITRNSGQSGGDVADAGVTGQGH